MKPRRSILTFAGILSLLLSPIALSNDKAAAKPAPATSQDEMMKAWMASATPGAPHKALDRFTGSWTVQAKTWMAPGAPPTETAGTSENKMILGGRYLEQHYGGTVMGQPFSGVGVTGFDNYKKKFFGTWVDSMSTAVMVTEGTSDKSGNVITSSGTMNDVAEKRAMKVKTVVTFVDADHHTYESWHTNADGKSVKVDYSSPRMKGRKIYGGLVTYGTWWRTGANDATSLVTSAAVAVEGTALPAGSYTLFTMPAAADWQLIVNKQTGQWGTEYDAKQDLFRTGMQKSALPSPVENFTISFDQTSPTSCRMNLDWETTRVSANITEQK